MLSRIHIAGSSLVEEPLLTAPGSSAGGAEDEIVFVSSSTPTLRLTSIARLRPIPFAF